MYRERAQEPSPAHRRLSDQPAFSAQRRVISTRLRRLSDQPAFSAQRRVISTRLRRLSDQPAFSLIELLVIILILGILATLAIPRFLGQRDAANDRAAKQRAEIGLRALKAEYTKAQALPGTDSTDLAAALAETEPGVSWTPASTFPAGPQTVHVQRNGTTVFLRSRSASGRAFMIISDENASGSGVVRVSGPDSLAPQTNLIANTSFESGTAGWAGNFGTAVSASTDWATHGRQSIRFITNGTGWVRYQTNAPQLYPAVPGRRYTFSADVRSVAAGVNAFMLQIRWNNGASMYADSSQNLGPDFTGTRRLSVTGIAPLGATHVEPWLYTDGNVIRQFEIYMDAVTLVEESSAAGYFDGSTAGGSWNGAANGSTSVGYPDENW